MAKTFASIEIGKRQAADKRWEKGEIVLKSPKNTKVFEIKVEE